MKRSEWEALGYKVTGNVLVKQYKSGDVAVEAPVSETIKKRIRQSSKPLMNKLELEYFDVLRKRIVCQEELLAQALRFRLGNGVWYKPDFVVLNVPIQCYEVKGPHAFRGGFENLKVAASLYTGFRWILVWKEGDQWHQQNILP